MIRRGNIWANIDWITVTMYILLIFMGWINIYSAVYNDQHQSIFDFSQRYGKQLLWIGLAILIAVIIILIDIKFYTFFAYFIYGFTILLLIVVLLFGQKVNGATSWLNIGGMQIQPSEFAKFATCLALARYLSTFNLNLTKFRNIFTSGIIIILPALLIMLQPDMGSVLVYFSLILVLYREGLSGSILFMVALVPILFILTLLFDKITIIIILVLFASLTNILLTHKLLPTLKILLIFSGVSAILWLIGNFLVNLLNLDMAIVISLFLTCAFVVVLTFIKKIKYAATIALVIISSVAFIYSADYVFDNILKKHQQQRVNILLGIEDDPLGIGYNVNQSKIAIGSGGFLGKGFLQGTQTKFDFVPEQSTDFIFCTVGEEWGLLGTTTIILLFTGLLLRLVTIAERQRSSFTRIYGYGVLSIFFFHVLVNVGMTIGILPVIGIPLPFFSYGGSSLWSFTILLFILLRLDASRLELLR